MDNPIFVILLIALLFVGYFFIKKFATKYFVNLYLETGNNMINRPRQLLGLLSGLSLFCGIVLYANSGTEFFLEVTLLVVASVVFILLSFLSNRKAGKKALACTIWQFALGLCFVGRLIWWIVEISLEFGSMVLGGSSARFTWHPFFLTIIDKNGNVYENKKTNVVINEDGAYKGSASISSSIEEDMNRVRISQQQNEIKAEIQDAELAEQEALSFGFNGAEAREKKETLEDQWNALENQKKKGN